MPHVSDHVRADFAQLRFNLSGRGHYIFRDGRQMESPQTCILGATMSSALFEVEGPLQTVGVSLLPLGWHALTGLDASEYVDSLFDAADLHPEFAELENTLRLIDDPQVGVDRLWDFLRRHFRRVNSAHRAFVEATGQWLSGDGSPRVETLIESTGLSARQVARLTNRLYGAPPKLLARKYRALRVASLIASSDDDWLDIVGDLFYDQSHLIRELKFFIGLTPHRSELQSLMRISYAVF